MQTKKPLRQQFLEEAIKLTAGDRDKEYGDPYFNLGDTADLVQAYLAAAANGRTFGPGSLQFQLQPSHMAIIMVLIKAARTLSGQAKPDTYIDGGCYFAIAGECRVREDEGECAEPGEGTY